MLENGCSMRSMERVSLKKLAAQDTEPLVSCGSRVQIEHEALFSCTVRLRKYSGSELFHPPTAKKSCRTLNATVKPLQQTIKIAVAITKSISRSGGNWSLTCFYFTDPGDPDQRVSHTCNNCPQTTCNTNSRPATERPQPTQVLEARMTQPWKGSSN